MSADSLPISPAAFTEAIKELTLPSLHAKAAELRNSIYHLRRSNVQLQPFADEGDGDCADAIKENDEVIERMQERIELLKLEVEVNRGMLWVEEPKADEAKEKVNGDAGDAVPSGHAAGQQAEQNTTQNQTATEAPAANRPPAASGDGAAQENNASTEEDGLFL